MSKELKTNVVELTVLDVRSGLVFQSSHAS